MDAASGVGATGKYLTQKGFLVFCFDISIVGLRIAKQKYAEGDLNFNGVVYDLTRPLFPANYFDAILNFFFLERVTFKEYRKSLKPGGLIFFETFVKDQDDVVAKHYLKKDELLEAFNGFEIIHYDQKTREGRSANSKRKVDQLIARKPI